MALEVVKSIHSQVRALPKLWLREQYIQSIAEIEALSKSGALSFLDASRAKYKVRRDVWRKMLRDPRLDPKWIGAWDSQIRGLLRKGITPSQIIDLMVVQAYERQHGPPGAKVA